MKLSEQKFIEAGYKRYDQPLLKSANYLLQKKITDEEGIKYFINIYVYRWCDKEYYQEDFPSVTFQPDVQFSSSKYDTMNVELLLDEATDIQEIEDTFENLWVSVGKPYYKKYHENDADKELCEE